MHPVPACGFADILQVANVHLRNLQGSLANRFKWRFVSTEGGQQRLDPKYVKPGSREKFDLDVIPGLQRGGQRAFARLLQAQTKAIVWPEAQ